MYCFGDSNLSSCWYGGGGHSLEILDSSLPSPYFSCVSDGRLFPSFFFFLSHYLTVSFSPELEKRFVFQQTKTFEFFLYAIRRL